MAIRLHLARSLEAAIALTKTPAPAAATRATTPQAIDLQTPQVEQAISYSGKVNGGILQFSVPRVEMISDSGMEVPPAMGTATAIKFQGTGQGKAASAVMRSRELRACSSNPTERRKGFDAIAKKEAQVHFKRRW